MGTIKPNVGAASAHYLHIEPLEITGGEAQRTTVFHPEHYEAPRKGKAFSESDNEYSHKIRLGRMYHRVVIPTKCPNEDMFPTRMTTVHGR